MKISSVQIRNFRSIAEQSVEFDDYTCLLGCNGSGKSNLLHALNIFFGESTVPGLSTRLLSSDDFHRKAIDRPVEVTVTFSDIPEAAKAELAHYVRQDQLIVTAVARFDSVTGKAEVKQFGRRLGLKDFAPFFAAEKEGSKVGELKDLYSNIRAQYTDLPSPTTKEAMLTALRSYEESHRESHVELPSGDEFYGVSKGRNHLEKYIQWVYVPAVKDVSTEQWEARDTALGKLLARTVRANVDFKQAIETMRAGIQREYGQLLADNQARLKEISERLAQRLVTWAHQGASVRLEWHLEPEKAVRIDEPFAQALLAEPGFEGDLTRFGHGLQRSFLLALLQELSGSDLSSGPTLILACEEPELYQHPPQARHLYNILLHLSEQNSQVVIATHSPYFVSGHGFENVRMVRKANGASVITRTSHEQVADRIAIAHGEKPAKPSGQMARIHQALQSGLCEMFFASKVVLVEGLEDSAYITSYLLLLDLWDEFRRLGCHLVPTNGKSAMIQPLAIAKCLQIPSFVVFDADGDKPDKNGSRRKHIKDNSAILALCGDTDLAYSQTGTVWGQTVTMWHSEIGDVVKGDIGPVEWEGFQNQADAEYGHVGDLQKNVLHISFSLQKAWETGKKSASLEKTCQRIIEFAKRND